eukprot:gene15131-20369_t
MVKGNWERRAELAAIRRDEKKNLKAAKKKGNDPNNGSLNNPSIDGIIYKLTYESMLTKVKEFVTIWLEDEDHNNTLCQEFFRTELCSNKKCNLGHHITLGSMIKNIYYDLDQMDGNVEIQCYALKLHEVPRKRRELLSMIIHEKQKAKKIDKKKKIKQANVKKVDKKDGFARGGNGGW